MNPLIQLKTIPPLLITLALLCFGLLPRAQAVDPPPDGGYPGQNTAEGQQALLSLTTGLWNTALGFQALKSDTTGYSNTATGARALFNNTAGIQNTANGAFALIANTVGGGNSAFGWNTLASNTTGNGNTANGHQALADNTTGVSNTAIGAGALSDNTTGDNNTANGDDALAANTTGFNNTAIGADALRENTTTEFNVAVGDGALTSFNGTGVNDGVNTALGSVALNVLTGGNRNVAVGRRALGSLTDGSNNVSVGWRAGDNYTGAETNNICIGQGTLGFAGESNSIRIGNNSDSHGIKVIQVAGPFGPNSIEIGEGWPLSGGITVRQALIGSNMIRIGAFLPAPTTTLIGGIYNSVPAPGSHPVVIGAGAQLADGTVSSRRFKKDIAPIDKLSEGILALKPVTFHFKNDDSNYPQFGLIAEEVAEVNPDWMTRDPQGEIYGVRYDTIPILLLNEFLKEHRTVQEQGGTIAELKKQIATLTATVKEQGAQIQKVSAQLETSKPAPQVVNNP